MEENILQLKTKIDAYARSKGYEKNEVATLMQKLGEIEGQYSKETFNELCMLILDTRSPQLFEQLYSRRHQ